MKLRLPRRHHHAQRDAGTPLLDCAGLEVSYGRTQILFDVSIDVDEGEVLAVLGTNGAGKSTLLRAITGLTPPKGGKVLLDGRDVRPWLDRDPPNVVAADPSSGSCRSGSAAGRR